MNEKRKNTIFAFSWHDLALTLAILLLAMLMCFVLQIVDERGEFVSLIFVMAVLFISRLTTGYLFGILASVAGVIGVNWIFTYPYLEINFTIGGYPLTFFTMLVVSILTCTMTTRIKLQEHLRAEGEAEKMRANLLRSVSHDIRTPLTSIVGAASVMRENQNTLSPDEQQKLLQDIQEEGQWLIRVVENILSITRIGADRAHILKQQEAAEEVLGASVQKFRKRFPAVKVSVSAPDELLMVPMDAVLIEQVLSNLLENAAIHGDPENISLSVAGDAEWAVFRVADDGRGIAPERLSRLFEQETRDNLLSTGDKKRNMGLGLSVCKAIVLAHGGDMTARNRAEGGAEFSFRLPLKEEEIS